MSKSIIAMLVMLVVLVAALLIPIMQMSKWDPELRRVEEQQRQRDTARPTASSESGGESDESRQRVSMLENAEQLKQIFNSEQGRPRIIAILSPTSSTSREAAQYMQEALLREQRQLDVSVHVVWIARRSNDSYEQAQAASALMPDERVSQYYGSDAAASYVADIMGYPGEEAWNIIMQFDGDALWEPEMPQPQRYLHQLGTDHWLGELNHATGNDLRNALAAWGAEMVGWSF